MSTYHQYQQILVLEGPSAGLKKTRARRKFTKSVHGCLQCKHRRKKCGEEKPVCLSCSRRGLDCQWPKVKKEDPLLKQFIKIQEGHKQEEIVTSEDTQCYDSFVSVFLSSITPAHCHPLLSPMSILLPYAVTNTTVKEIFLACGATSLAYNDNSFIQKAHNRYHQCVKLLINDIQRSTDGCEDHLFISVQLLQTLCLRDKSLGLNATKTAAHLSAAFEILKKRFSKNVKVTPLDKILTEHFVFNYSITLLMCHHDKLGAVPSPFDFFQQFGWILEAPLNESSSDDPWLNNPILGIGLVAHELSAKCSWMCRLKQLPLSAEDLLLCLELKDRIVENLKQLELTNLDTLEKSQKQTLSFSKSVLYGSMILLKKLCDDTIEIHDVQKELALLVKEMEYSKMLDSDYFQPIWAMFIGGSVSITPEHRDFFTERFQNVSNIIHSSLSEKVLRYLKIVWSEESDQPVGMDFLFDTTVLDIVCS